MSKFVLKNIESVTGKMSFKQLIILADETDAEKIQLEIDNIESGNSKHLTIDGIPGIKPGVLDIYELELEAKYQSSFSGILTYMNLVADLKSVPKQKYHPLKNPQNGTKDFEFKNGDLRVYGIDVPGGKIIMLGGFKNNQESDITQLRALTKKYLESIKSKTIKHEKGRIT